MAMSVATKVTIATMIALSGSARRPNGTLSGGITSCPRSAAGGPPGPTFTAIQGK